MHLKDKKLCLSFTWVAARAKPFVKLVCQCPLALQNYRSMPTITGSQAVTNMTSFWKGSIES